MGNHPGVFDLHFIGIQSLLNLRKKIVWFNVKPSVQEWEGHAARECFVEWLLLKEACHKWMITISYLVTLPHPALPYLILPSLTLLFVTLSYLTFTLPYFILSYIILPSVRLPSLRWLHLTIYLSYLMWASRIALYIHLPLHSDIQGWIQVLVVPGVLIYECINFWMDECCALNYVALVFFMWIKTVCNIYEVFVTSIKNTFTVFS